MGRRGPRPMPEALRKMRGRRHRKKEANTLPELPVGAPPMPDIVRNDKIASATWKRVCQHLLEMRVLHPSHWAALAVLCCSYATAQRMSERLQRDALLLKTRSGRLYTHPAYRVEQQAWARCLRCAQEFGLTPSAATRLRANLSPEAAKQQQEQEELEEFLFGDKGKRIGSTEKERK